MMLSRVSRYGISINTSQLSSRIDILRRHTQMYSTLSPFFHGSKYIGSRIYLKPNEVRRFQVKAGKPREDVAPHQSTPVTADHVQKRTSDLAEELNLSQKQYLSLQLGVQQGLSMQKGNTATQTSKKSSKPYLEIAVIAIAVGIIYLFYKGDTMKVMVSFTANDYRAEIPDVTFSDVQGIDEVKGELQEIVDFLKDPDRFTSLGAKLPKGVLLSGPPGTGKTLLARAVAGEAGVPFYYAAGSEFDEMFVGVGSSRIRKLFQDAQENSPCIIFIDEIDACGSTRTSSALAPYGRVTINQLLQEMDGFETKQGIIVMGATNMEQVLDKALTRPGRFDTEIKVLPPDIKGRKEILEYYSNKISRTKNINLDRIACLTGGMTGADLSNLVNQAALLAAQCGKRLVDMEDYENALDKLRLGPELKTRLRTQKELETTAYHEAGHALVAYYSPNSMPIFKVTIAQRGHTMGHTSLIPNQEDETNLTRAKIMWKIDVAMGGRVAEELLNGSSNVTTGASNDLEMATRLAYSLVCDFGMSEALGFVAFDLKKVSPGKKRMIEKEVNKILSDSYNRAKSVLSDHSHQHNLLSKALLKYETLSLDDMKIVINFNSVDALDKPMVEGNLLT